MKNEFKNCFNFVVKLKTYNKCVRKMLKITFAVLFLLTFFMDINGAGATEKLFQRDYYGQQKTSENRP